MCLSVGFSAALIFLAILGCWMIVGMIILWTRR